MKVLTSKLSLLCYLLFFIILAPHLTVSQEIPPLTIGEEFSGTLTPDSLQAVFTFTAARNELISITLDFDQRNFGIDLIMLDPAGNQIAQNTGTNPAYFSGAYLLERMPTEGLYEIHISAINLTDSAEFSLLVEKHNHIDRDQSIRVDEEIQGLLTFDDQDAFFFSHHNDSPVLINIYTPKEILNPLIGVFDMEGNLVNVVENFYSSSPLLLLKPEPDSIYTIIVQGVIPESVGPYSIEITPVTKLGNPPASQLEQLLRDGEPHAYEMTLREDTTYSFHATGSESMQPVMILTDINLTIIAWNEANDESLEIEIPGFTPLFDSPLYLFVLGNQFTSRGEYELEINIEDDEPDGFVLEPGEHQTITIGPVGDIDRGEIIVEENKAYSLIFGTDWHLLDPAIRILNPDGEEVYFNDDAVLNNTAILSNITFPTSGNYTIELLASPHQPAKRLLTGVGSVFFAEGAPFDQVRPIVIESEATVTDVENQKQITFPTTMFYDDTYPLSATMTVDHTGEQHLFDIYREEDFILDIDHPADSVYFLTISDAADSKNTTQSFAIPGPTVIADVTGMPYGIAMNHNNEIFITDAHLGGIYKVNLDGSREIFHEGEPSAGGSFGPNDLVFDSQNNLYLTNGMSNQIIKITPNGTTSIFADGLAYPVAMAIDGNDVIYVAQLITDTIDKIYPDQSRETFVTGIKNPNGLAFAPDGLLYVGNSDRGQSSIYQIQPDGTPQPFISEFAQTLEGLAFDVDGYLYAIDGVLGIVYRIDSSGDYMTFTGGLSGPSDITFGYNDYANTIFATNMGTIPDQLYPQQLIAFPTGRTGFKISETSIRDWILR